MNEFILILMLFFSSHCYAKSDSFVGTALAHLQNYRLLHNCEIEVIKHENSFDIYLRDEFICDNFDQHCPEVSLSFNSIQVQNFADVKHPEEGRKSFEVQVGDVWLRKYFQVRTDPWGNISYLKAGAIDLQTYKKVSEVTCQSSIFGELL